MKLNLVLPILFLTLFSTAKATVYNDRSLFESAISVIYSEDFESLSGPATSRGGSLTLPTGLNAFVNVSGGDELFSVPAGYVGPRGPLPNTSTVLGDRSGLDSNGNGDGLFFNLGAEYQAVGFDFYTNFDLSNQNVGADFDIGIGTSSMSNSPGFETLVGQFGGGLSTRGDPLFPVAGFFGFVNDGNPLDIFDINDPFRRQNGFVSLVQEPGLFFDEFYIDRFDGNGIYEFVDNITVGVIDHTTPVSVAAPPSGVLLLLGMTGLFAFGAQKKKLMKYY